MRTLIVAGNEQKAQQQDVCRQQARFKALLSDVRQGGLLAGLRQERVLARYGEPVLREGRTFVYRDPVGFFGSPKVYLTFDSSHLLSSIEVIDDAG